MPNRGQTCSALCTEYPLSVHLEPPQHWIIGAMASLTPTPYTSTQQSVLQKSCSFNCISQQVCYSTFSQNFSLSFPNRCKLMVSLYFFLFASASSCSCCACSSAVSSLLSCFSSSFSWPSCSSPCGRSFLLSPSSQPPASSSGSLDSSLVPWKEKWH